MKVNMTMQDENVELVKKFVYLGSTFTRQDECDGNIEKTLFLQLA